MVRTVTPSQLDVIVIFTFERQAKLSCVHDFKRQWLAIPYVRQCADLEGAGDFMVEVELPNLASYHDMVATQIDPARRLISHYEANFVSRHMYCDEGEVRQLWTADAGGTRRIDLDRAQWIASEGDYVRVSVNGETALVHTTLHSISERLTDLPFLQIHRSTLINLQAVRRVSSEGRRWFVELVDGSTHRIAKGRAAEVTRHLAGSHDAHATRSSTPVPSNGPVRPIDRKIEALPLGR